MQMSRVSGFQQTLINILAPLLLVHIRSSILVYSPIFKTNMKINCVGSDPLEMKIPDMNLTHTLVAPDDTCRVLTMHVFWLTVEFEYVLIRLWFDLSINVIPYNVVYKTRVDSTRREVTSRLAVDARVARFSQYAFWSSSARRRFIFPVPILIKVHYVINYIMQ